jgi:pimeloyl-ACP methyl ester carboxylesterase
MLTGNRVMAPLVLLHGITGTGGDWSALLPRLQRTFDVVSPTFPGHAGGPAPSLDLAGFVEAQMDAAGWATAHVAGNSLGGYVALQLAERGRARSVVAFAPAGGWADGDLTHRDTLQRTLDYVGAARGSPDSRAMAAVACTGLGLLTEHALTHGWPLDPTRVDCPLRFIWGTTDEWLPWPRSAARYRSWFPRADWIELDGVGHEPQIEVPLEAAELIRGFP